MSLSTLGHAPRLQRYGNVTILTFTQVLTRDIEDVIARELGPHTAASGALLLLDFANVNYVNSVELGTLISLHKRVHSAGGRLILFNLQDQLLEVFRVTRLDTLLGVCAEVVPLTPMPRPGGTRCVGVPGP